MYDIANLVRPRNSFFEVDHTDDICRLNLLLSKYGLQVDDVIDAPTITTYISNLDIDTKINQILRAEKNIGIAVKDNNVRVYLDGDKLCIEKKGADNEVAIDDIFRELRTDRYDLMIGIDNRNNRIICDLAKAPHILVAGTTGSGKSIFLHSCILSLLINHSKDIEIVGIDPKGTEFQEYSPLPNFTFVKDTSTAIQYLKLLVNEMEKRYTTMALARCRDIEEYNASNEPMKRKVCIVDELADLMLTGGKQVEAYIVRLAQKARACGIHLILATQRPSADIITGLIKANIPTRVCLTVKGQIDSRIILDEKGGEKLNGHGDMLYQANGAREVVRAQGVYFTKQEQTNIIYYSFYEQNGKNASDYITKEN